MVCTSPRSKAGLCHLAPLVPLTPARAWRRGAACTTRVRTYHTGQHSLALGSTAWLLALFENWLSLAVLAGTSFFVILSQKCNVGRQASSEAVGTSLSLQWKLTLQRVCLASSLSGFCFVSQVSGFCSLDWCVSSQ